MDRSLGSLRARSFAVSVFAALLCIAALVELGFAGREVTRYYEHRAELTALAQQYYSEPPPDYGLAAAYGVYAGSLGTSPAGASEEPRTILAEPAMLAAFALGVAMLGFTVAALMWVWRAHANLEAAGLRPKFTARKALVAYIVPLANLVLPSDAMREPHNRSHGENGDFIDAPVDDVTAWWTAGISGLVILSALIAKLLLDGTTNLAIVTPLWMEFAMACFAILLLMLCAVLFARLARIVTSAQAETLHDGMAALEPDATQPRGVRLIGS